MKPTRPLRLTTNKADKAIVVEELDEADDADNKADTNKAIVAKVDEANDAIKAAKVIEAVEANIANEFVAANDANETNKFVVSDKAKGSKVNCFYVDDGFAIFLFVPTLIISVIVCFNWLLPLFTSIGNICRLLVDNDVAIIFHLVFSHTKYSAIFAEVKGYFEINNHQLRGFTIDDVCGRHFDGNEINNQMLTV